MFGAKLQKQQDWRSIPARRAGTPAELAGVGVACLLAVAVALATFAPPVSATPTAYLPNFFTNTVSAYSLASDGDLSPIAGSPFSAGGIAPLGVAITPDGSHMYVTNLESQSVSAFELDADGSPEPVPGSPFATGVWPWGVAVSPDGEHLYVVNDGSDSVSAYSIAADGSLSPVSGSPFLTQSGAKSNGIAATPDGQHLYVTNQGTASVVAFSIAADGSLTPVAGSPFAAGSTPKGARVTPDGKYLYVANATSGSISAYLIGSNGVLSPVTGSPFPTEGAPGGLAITPNGESLYVSHVGEGNKVWGYTIGSDGSLSPVPGAPFPTGGRRSNGVGVSPDGRHLYVTNLESIDISSFMIGSAGTLTAVAGSPFATWEDSIWGAIPPDQGPLAAFEGTPTPAGNASSFDASASSDPDGQVATYHWDFGDGHSEVTPTAEAAHTYASDGEYTVSLRVVDETGCSTAQTYTGQTASCNGSSLAEVSHQVTVPPGVPLDVSLMGSGSGSVASTPTGIACPEGCSYAYEPGTPVALAATPAPGSTFTGWSGGGCSGTASTCEVSVSEAKSVEAEFTINTYDLGVTTAGDGSGGVSSSPTGINGCGMPGGACEASFQYGAVIALKATPAADSNFAGWSGGGCSGTGTCQVALSANTEVTAAFHKVATSPLWSGPPSPPRSTPSKSARLRIRHVRLVRSICRHRRHFAPQSHNLDCAKLGVAIRGTIAKAASGVVIFKAKARLRGRRTTVTRRAWITHGRWHAGLALPRIYSNPRASIYLVARFKGSPGIQHGHAKRRV